MNINLIWVYWSAILVFCICVAINIGECWNKKWAKILPKIAKKDEHKEKTHLIPMLMASEGNFNKTRPYCKDKRWTNWSHLCREMTTEKEAWWWINELDWCVCSRVHSNMHIRLENPRFSILKEIIWKQTVTSFTVHDCFRSTCLKSCEAVRNFRHDLYKTFVEDFVTKDSVWTRP